jgi:hypothetical protein
MKTRFELLSARAVLSLIGFMFGQCWLHGQVLGNGPVQQIWRSDLVNQFPGPSYKATVATLDSFNNLFVAGSVYPRNSFVPGVPCVAKFNEQGIKEWEYWFQTNVVDLVTTDGLTSDGRGGVFAGLRVAGGGIQMGHIDSGGNLEYLARATNCAILQGYINIANSVHLEADGANGFYFLGLFPQETNSLWFSLIHYDEYGQVLWSTNLCAGALNGAGLGRAVAVSSNRIILCVPGDSVSHLINVNTNGYLEWTRDSKPFVAWSRLAVLADQTVCVSGERNFEVWSPNGELLASHGASGFSTVARQTAETNEFLVSDFASANLVQLDGKGVIRAVGQIPAPPLEVDPPELVGMSGGRWLVGLNCPEGIVYTNNFSLFEFGPTGQLSWRQRLPGFEYKNQDRTQLAVPQHWLLKASDGTIRLVANLNVLGANGHSGVAVAGFSLTNQYEVPTLVSYTPATNINTQPIQLEVVANDTGQLSYQWCLGGIAWIGATNASFTVDSPGVYCARILHGSGEIVTPAMNVVRNSDAYQTLKLDSQGIPVLSIVPGIALQFQVESSTNLVDWLLDPVVYSWMQDVPTQAISAPGKASASRFFRHRSLMVYPP